MKEAIDRVASSPLDRALAERGRDHDSVHLQSVLTRLRGLEAAT